MATIPTSQAFAAGKVAQRDSNSDSTSPKTNDAVVEIVPGRPCENPSSVIDITTARFDPCGLGSTIQQPETQMPTRSSNSVSEVLDNSTLPMQTIASAGRAHHEEQGDTLQHLNDHARTSNLSASFPGPGSQIPPQTLHFINSNGNVTIHVLQAGASATIAGTSSQMPPRMQSAPVEAAPGVSTTLTTAGHLRRIETVPLFSATSTQTSHEQRRERSRSWASRAYHSLKRRVRSTVKPARSDLEPFVVMIEIEADEGAWSRTRMLLDTGCNINLVHPRELRKLGLQHGIKQLMVGEINCASFSGHDVRLTGTISLHWRWNFGKKYFATFYVVEDENDAVSEVVLGSWSLTQYRMVKICAFGGELIRIPSESVQREFDLP